MTKKKTAPPKKRGPKPGTGGRPALGKVKLTCWVKPETRAKMGDRPGEWLDGVVGGGNRKAKRNIAPIHAGAINPTIQPKK